MPFITPFRYVPYVMLASACVCGGANADEGHFSTPWRYLLDAQLSAWETWLGVPHSSVPIDWYGKSDNVTEVGSPMGLDNDPLGVFSCRLVNGEPVLFVSGQIYGALTSLNEYSNYHLKLQVRWGERKWSPRAHAKRDSGLLIHCVGPHGAFWNAWMRCLECQIQEGDIGDFFALAGAGAKVRVVDLIDSERPRYEPQGELQPKGLVSHGPSVEAPHGEWNTVEVYAIEDACVFIVNGRPVMALNSVIQRGDEGCPWQPLTGGRLQIQSEGAEVEYRRIRIRHIAAWPEDLSRLIVRTDDPSSSARRQTSADGKSKGARPCRDGQACRLLLQSTRSCFARSGAMPPYF